MASDRLRKEQGRSTFFCRMSLFFSRIITRSVTL